MKERPTASCSHTWIALTQTCSRSSKVDVSLPDASRDSASRCVGLFTGAVDFFLKREHGGVLANLSERRLRLSAETEGVVWCPRYLTLVLSESRATFP